MARRNSVQLMDCLQVALRSTNTNQVEDRDSDTSTPFVSVTNRKFSANKQKAIKKKVDAANRKEPNTVVLHDDCLVMRCQAGLYEVIRRSMHLYFMHRRKLGFHCTIDLHREQSADRLVVESTYRISKDNKALYTVNLYHTKSSMLVNGGQWQQFLDQDWPEIVELINSVPSVNHAMINTQILQQLNTIQGEMKDRSRQIQNIPARRNNKKTHQQNKLSGRCTPSSRNIGATPPGYEPTTQTTDTPRSSVPSLLGIQTSAPRPHTRQGHPVRQLRSGKSLTQPMNTPVISPVTANTHVSLNASSKSINSGAGPHVTPHVDINALPSSPVGVIAPAPLSNTGTATPLGHPPPSHIPLGPPLPLPAPALGGPVSLHHTPSLPQATPGLPQAPPGRPLAQPDNGAQPDGGAPTTPVSSGPPTIPGMPSLTAQPGNPPNLRTSVTQSRARTNPSIAGTEQNQVAPDPSHQRRIQQLTDWERDLNARETELKAMERRLKAQEKVVIAREKDIDKKQSQFEAQKACLIGYEAKIKELQGTNAILQQLIDANPALSQHQPGQPHLRHDNNTPQPTPVPGNNSDEIHKLREELGRKDLELRMTEKMHQMETRLTQANALTNMLIYQSHTNHAPHKQSHANQVSQPTHSTAKQGQRRQRSRRRKNKEVPPPKTREQPKNSAQTADSSCSELSDNEPESSSGTHPNSGKTAATHGGRSAASLLSMESAQQQASSLIQEILAQLPSDSERDPASRTPSFSVRTPSSPDLKTSLSTLAEDIRHLSLDHNDPTELGSAPRPK